MRAGTFVGLLLIAVAAQPVLPGGEGKEAGSRRPGWVEFEANVQRYLEVRKTAVKPAGDLKRKADPASVIAHEQELAEAIRKARPDAKAGDVLTPAAQKYFQGLTSKQVRAPGGVAVKDTIKQGNPATEKEGADVELKVNGTYPKAAPKSTMPPSLLARFPKLPKELEYRFIGRTLVLLDVPANLIIDYAPQVGPPQ
ncbi:MAG: hypothetical protein IT168_05675 [Bryobacterales bacterium]|nr:hypothetical protein [Bryobacterales bacterium]